MGEGFEGDVVAGLFGLDGVAENVGADLFGFGGGEAVFGFHVVDGGDGDRAERNDFVAVDDADFLAGLGATNPAGEIFACLGDGESCHRDAIETLKRRGSI